MADDRRYGHDQSRGYGLQGQGGSLGYGDRGRDGSQGGSGQPHDRDRDRDFGGYSQGGSFGQGQPGGGQVSQPTPPPAAFDRAGRDNERFDNRDADHRVAIDETDRLIASNKVEGTRVYNRHGERLGSIHNFMVDKRAGKVEYAVMSFGGFLGMGERYYPLPWQVLEYDQRLGGYVIHLDGDERALSRAPSFRSGDEPRFDRAYGQHVYGFYGLTY